MVGELGGQAQVVATGAQAELVAGLTQAIDVVDPLLTLEGLRLIHELNINAQPGR
jgi:type III pantothenate kinase